MFVIKNYKYNILERVIVEKHIPRNMIINLGCASVDNHIPRDDVLTITLSRMLYLYIIPTLLRRGYCNRLNPSSHPLCYLLLNHWTKSIQIWCVSYSHKWGVQQIKMFGHVPWGPGEGSKGQISLNYNT